MAAERSDINITGVQMDLDLDTSGVTAAMNNFATATVDLEESFTQSAEQILGTTTDLYASITENMADIGDYYKLNLEQATQETQELSKLIELSDELDQYHQDETKFWEDMLDNLDLLMGNIEDKNKLHEIEKSMIGKEGELLQENNNAMRRAGENLKDFNDILNDIYRAYQRIVSFAVKTDQAAEAFVTTNYRAYGSQQQLAAEVRTTTIQYGLLADKAIEAAALAGTMAVQRSELERYTKILAQTTRFTGLATNALRDHAFRMRQVGVGAGQIEEHYAKLAEGMRKYKLSTEDMSRVMEDTTWTPATVEMLFGEGAAQKYELMRQALVGIGKESGVATESITGMFSAWEDMDNLIMLERLAPSGAITSMEDYKAAVLAAAEYARELVAEQEAMEALGHDQAARNIGISMERYAQTIGLANENQIAQLAALDETALAQYEQAGTLEEVMDLTKRYNEASRTLTQTVAQLGSTIWSVVGKALEPLRYTLEQINTAILWISQTLSPIIAKFSEWWTKLEEGAPLVANILKFTAGAIQLFAGLVVILGPTVFLFGRLFGLIRGFVGWWAGAGMASLSGITTGLTALARAIGTAANYLWPAVGVALGFAAALLMAGGGAYLFASALEKVTDILADADKTSRMFWQALIGLGGAMIAFVISIAVAIGILAALGTAIAPVQPLLWALVAVLGALSVLAVIVGYGMKLFGEGVLKAGMGMHHLGKGMAIVSENWLGITSWFQLALGLGSVAKAALLAAPMMRNVTRSMQELAAVNVGELANGIKTIADSLERLSSDALTNMARDTLGAVWLMNLAKPAITSLVAGLKAAGVDLQGVAEIFETVSTSLERLIATFDALRKGAHRFETERWLGSLRSLAFAIEGISDRIEASVDKFSASIDQLTQSLSQLAEAGASIRGIGSRLSAELDSLVAPMEDYSERLETASEKLEDAIENKVLPAVRAAERAGERVGETPEAVTSIEILPPEREDRNQLRIVALLEQQNSILDSLNESIQGLGGDDVRRIKDIMEEKEATDEVASSVPNLSSDMAAWS